MKLGRHISLVIIGVLTVFVLQLLIPGEPTYQRQPASHWLELWTTYDLDKMNQSEEAFAAMGPSGVSFLIRSMETRPSQLDVKLSDWSEHHELPDWLASRLPDEFVIQRRRLAAVDLISELGTTAQSAASVLRHICNDSSEDPDLKKAARRAIVEIGEKP